MTMTERDLSQTVGTAEGGLDSSPDAVEPVQAHGGSTTPDPSDGQVREWLSLAEAQRQLGVMSEAVVEYWAGMGWLRSRTAPDGRMEVPRADVVREKTIRDGLGAFGGDEMPPDELDGADRDLDYTPPWAPNAGVSSGEEVEEWLDPAEAQRELGVMSEAVVEYWAEMGWLRSRRGPDDRLEVLRADVLERKREHKGLTAIGGDELTPEELEELVEGGPGTLPWERKGANPSR